MNIFEMWYNSIPTLCSINKYKHHQFGRNAHHCIMTNCIKCNGWKGPQEGQVLDRSSMMKMIGVLPLLLCQWQAKWAELPPKAMKQSQRWNDLQILPRRDSNAGGSDLWSNTPPLDHRNNNMLWPTVSSAMVGSIKTRSAWSIQIIIYFLTKSKLI